MLVLAVLGLCVLAGSLQASMISIVDIPATNSDTNAGSSASNVYTHALDFSTSSATLSINGVAFTKVLLNGDKTAITPTSASYGVAWDAGISMNIYGTGILGSPPADGNMATMLDDAFIPYYADSMYLTLSGLSAHTGYSTRVYYRPDSVANDPDRTNTLTFNGDGTDASKVIDENHGTSGALCAV